MGTVVATDTASVNAGYDNGAVALYDALGSRRDCERAAHRLITGQAEPVVDALETQHPAEQVFMHLPISCGRASVLTEAWSSPSRLSEHDYAWSRIWTSQKTPAC